MGSVDLVQLLQSKFPSENIVACIDASLMQGWVRTTRFLVVLSNGLSSALFILTSNNVPPTSSKDISVERIIPIDNDFKCDIDSDNKDDSGTDLYLNISSGDLKLLFELILGEKSNMFVNELYKASDKINKKNGSVEVGWLKKYNPLMKSNGNGIPGKEASDPLLDESPDVSLPRESIASGAALIAARETVIRYQMSMLENDYTFKQSLSVFVGTWNVNGQPPSVGLADWLACDIEPPDIYAIGFQELDLSKEAFLFNDTPREEEWRNEVEKGLHNGAKYDQIALVRLVGMMLIIFVQKGHQVKRVAIDTVGTGIMGKMGNKGGVSVRMEVHNTSMCFVNAHLAAHVEEFERRNQDFKDICSRTLFTSFTPPKSIKDHDQIYWLGDLNYRITGLSPTVVKKHIETENYSAILEYDQLNRQRKSGAVFQNFIEGSITFRPTYKYDTGTDNWDSSEKNRAPAWCDRILWRGKSIQQIDYRSHNIYRISDHKPVSSLFRSEVRIIDTVKYRKIHEEVMKKLDRLENEFLPQAHVDTNEIQFDTVVYLESQTRDLIIANVGQVPVKFEFIKKLDDTNYCKDWLRIEPYMGDVKPGEKCDIKLEVLVDKKSAYKLNSGQDHLYDILVLHLVGGKDIFITVTGEYERSCFGTSLETLANIQVPIKEIPVGKLVEMEKKRGVGSLTALEDRGGSYPVPKEVWFLVDHLHRHGMKQPHLFIQPGLPSEISAIRHWLDNWSLVPLHGSVHSVAEALLLLLDSTPEPIVPYELHHRSLEAASNYLQCKQIVQELPYHSKNVFIYLCLFLRELLTHSEDNGLDIKTLATVFGGVFLRDPPSDGTKIQQSQQSGSKSWTSHINSTERKKSTFVSHFLVNEDPHLYHIVAASN